MTLIIPQHEQHFPDKLLPFRLEEYVVADGPPTRNRAHAKKVTGQYVVDAIEAAKAETKLTHIDNRYYVGTCFHESGCENEWDTEIASASCHEGFVSVGAYQIGREEAESFGFQLADMLDLYKASVCFVRLAERNRTFLRKYAGLADGAPDPDYTDPKGALFLEGNMRAYLGIAHNHGLGYARSTIASYGMNFAAYLTRNPQDNIVAHGYGIDCVTGGAYWPQPAPGAPPTAPGHRVLQLTHPFMTGEDVRELQRHLRAVAPEVATDGVFGPQTLLAVQKYELSIGTTVTEVVEDVLWAKLLAQGA